MDQPDQLAQPERQDRLAVQQAQQVRPGLRAQPEQPESQELQVQQGTMEQSASMALLEPRELLDLVALALPAQPDRPALRVRLGQRALALRALQELQDRLDLQVQLDLQELRGQQGQQERARRGQMVPREPLGQQVQAGRDRQEQQEPLGRGLREPLVPLV